DRRRSPGGVLMTDHPRRQHIKFSEDWDKLKWPRFTTIRTYRPRKFEFYRSHIGEEFTILRVERPTWSWGGRKVGTATLRRVERVVPREIYFGDLRADVMIAGKMDMAWMARLLAMDHSILLEFENHTGLLKEFR
ncbi:MAG: hypothetical protein ACREB9_05445, partial [Thermoplasmata archaeon]